MTNDVHHEFQRRLNLSRNGGAILFCGAGFSADCLNFKPNETLGTGAQLLNLFNAELNQSPPYKDLKNAADALWEQKADYGMLELLKERFTVADVTIDMTEMLTYPWETVYTTNYDNALELAATAKNKPAAPYNNTASPDIPASPLPIVHLHGFVGGWGVHNVKSSCVLGAESYSRLTHVRKWMEKFRRDVDQAQIVVFVGFNAADFHLNEAIQDLTGLREKAFFINRPTAVADPDVAAAQKRLGSSLYIGRSGLSAELTRLLQTDAPSEPRLASFTKFEPPAPAIEVPTAEQIENLFLFGEVDPSQIARDALANKTDYHLKREAVELSLSAIEDGARVILFDGHPCDGKSLLTNDLEHRLSGARSVYRMRQPYDSLLNEVSSILNHAPNAVLIVENCFDLPIERLTSIAKQIDGSDGILLLTSRAIAVDASSVSMSMLENLDSFRKFSIDRLSETEAATLNELTDQIAGWRDFQQMNHSARMGFILKTCKASLPHFLMRLLKSEYVTKRYKQELSTVTLSEAEKRAIIFALYVAHIGESTPVSFLSNTLGEDVGATIDALNHKTGNGAFRIVRRDGPMISTVPSIGAEIILRELFDDNEIVDTVTELLACLSSTFLNSFEQGTFNQMMRFSRLASVVKNESEIDRFFERNKRHPQIRRLPPFWVQWHMAKCDAGKLLDAEKFLEQGFTQAKEVERHKGTPYDFRHLNDRRAKFLMLRAKKTDRSSAELFRDFKESIELTRKNLGKDDPTPHPFDAVKEIDQTLTEVGHRLIDAQKKIVEQWFNDLYLYAQKRLGILSDGYERNKAEHALAKISSSLKS